MFIERGVDFHNNESTFVSIYKQIIMYKYKCYQIEPQTRLKVRDVLIESLMQSLRTFTGLGNSCNIPASKYTSFYSSS